MSKGDIHYENLSTGDRWFTALDQDSNLYFYTLDPDTKIARSEWALPSAQSIIEVDIFTIYQPTILSTITNCRNLIAHISKFLPPTFQLIIGRSLKKVFLLGD